MTNPIFHLIGNVLKEQPIYDEQNYKDICAAAMVLPNWEKYLSTLRTFHASPSLVATGRTEFGEDELMLLWTDDNGKFPSDMNYNNDTGKKVAYLKEKEEDLNNVQYWNTMKAPLIEQVQRHDWRNVLEIIKLLDNQFNTSKDGNTNR